MGAAPRWDKLQPLEKMTLPELHEFDTVKGSDYLADHRCSMRLYSDS